MRTRLHPTLRLGHVVLAVLLSSALMVGCSDIPGAVARTSRPDNSISTRPTTLATTATGRSEAVGASTRPTNRDGGSGSPIVPGEQVVVEPNSGARIVVPAGWERRPSADYALAFGAVGVASADASVTVDVPDLPPHIPGWIPIGLVRNGYADDVRQMHPGATVTDQEPWPVAGASTRHLRAEWPDGQGTVAEAALVVVRGDHVLILRGTARRPHAKVTLDAFYAIARSLTWTR
jgi:hypothetical protein